MALPTSSVVGVDIVLTESYPPRGNFSILNIITNEGGVLTTLDRIKTYQGIDEVAEDWGTSTEAYKAAQTYFSQSPSPEYVAISYRDAANETITESLDAIEDVDPYWYGFMFTKEMRDLVNINGASDVGPIEAAKWAEARKKIFGNETNSADTISSLVDTDIGTILRNGEYKRTISVYSSTVDDYPMASVFSKAFTVDFDSTNSVLTLKFKTLPTITPETIRSSVKNTLDGKNVNVYLRVGNRDEDAVNMFAEGQMASGDFFDEIHGVDWIANAIETELFGFLYTSTTRIPLTDEGGSRAEQRLISVLDEGRNNGLIAPGTTTEGVFLPRGYETSVQQVADINNSDKAARVGPNLTFIFLFASAMHNLQVNGTAE